MTRVFYDLLCWPMGCVECPRACATEGARQLPHGLLVAEFLPLLDGFHGDVNSLAHVCGSVHGSAGMRKFSLPAYLWSVDLRICALTSRETRLVHVLQHEHALASACFFGQCHVAWRLQMVLHVLTNQAGDCLQLCLSQSLPKVCCCESLHLCLPRL